MAVGNPITLTSNVASKTISVTATASQTLFTVTGGYRINQLAVFRNGVRLVDQTDYTARDGSTVTLLSPATGGDVLEFQVFDDFRVADAIVSAESEQTISGELYVTGGINIGIQSSGTNITTGVITAINFTGVGNTFAYNSSTKTVDVSISGSAGAGGTWAVGASGIHTTKNVGVATDAAKAGLALYVNGNQFNTGILTATTLSATSGSFSGNVSIGGTLTYEDVTNVDSIGVITARSGINITSGGLNAVGVITAAEYDGYLFLDNQLF